MRTLVMALCLTLAGCAQWRAVGEQKAAESADTALAVGIWQVCEATTLGAAKRRFSNSDDLMQFITNCEVMRR